MQTKHLSVLNPNGIAYLVCDIPNLSENYIQGVNISSTVFSVWLRLRGRNTNQHELFKEFCISSLYSFPPFELWTRPVSRKPNHVLRGSMNRSNSWLCYRIGGAEQPGLAPWINAARSPKVQCLLNFVCGVGLPIFTFASMSWTLVRSGYQCDVAKFHFRPSRCIASACLSMLVWNALFVLDNSRM